MRKRSASSLFGLMTCGVCGVCRGEVGTSVSSRFGCESLTGHVGWRARAARFGPRPKGVFAHRSGVALMAMSTDAQETRVGSPPARMFGQSLRDRKGQGGGAGHACPSLAALG